MDDHAHDHGTGASRTRLAIALAITLGVLVAEFIGAAMTGSLALLVDAAHMTTDAVGLVIAFSAAVAMTAKASDRRTWGLLRFEVVAASAQALLLLGVAVYVIVEAITRLGAPAEVPGTELLGFAIAGLVGNLAAMWVLASGRRRSLNVRAAFTEVLGDALGSVAVIVAAVVIATTGFGYADVIAAIAIGAFIVPRAARLLRDSVAVVLESTPREIDLAELREHLAAVPGVGDVHDLHVSRISTEVPVLTAHVVVEDACFEDGRAAEILAQLQSCAHDCFPIPIEHATFQLELAGHAAGERDLHA